MLAPSLATFSRLASVSRISRSDRVARSIRTSGFGRAPPRTSTTTAMPRSCFRADGLTDAVQQDTTIHPGWEPGQKQPNPAGHHRMVEVDPADPEIKSCYPMMISGVVPRPVAFVSTISDEGVANVAPFSYFGPMSHDPPCVAFSVVRKAGDVKKDTATNLEANGECVVHIISEWFIEAANHTCGEFLPEEDEMDISGLTKVPSKIVKPPRCEEAAFAMEGKLKHSYDVVNKAGVVTTTMFVVEVVLFHVHEDVYQASDGRPRVNFSGFQPISRVGGNTYSRTTHLFDLARPKRPETGK